VSASLKLLHNRKLLQNAISVMPVIRLLWRYRSFINTNVGGMGVRREGGKTGISPLEIGTKKQKFLKSVRSAFWFWSVGLILAITVCVPIWHLHYKKVMFTVLVA